jgi:hypothetical protein
MIAKGSVLHERSHMGGQHGFINRLHANWRPSSRKLPQARLLVIILIIAGKLHTIGASTFREKADNGFKHGL